MHLSGRFNLARNVTSEFNGQLGMGANGRDNVLENCKLIGNNTLDYPVGWEAGGIKAVLTRRFRISGCTAIKNKGAGFWFDIDNRDGIIERSYAVGNDTGIMVEMSRGITVSNNVALKNGLRKESGWDSAGLLIAESMDTSVEHNVCVNNRTGIGVRQQGVRVMQTSDGLGRVRTAKFYSAGLVLQHNIAAFNRRWQFALFGDNSFFAGGYLWTIRRLLGNHGTSGEELQLLNPSNWHWHLDHNVYFAANGGGLILWGAPWLPGHQTYASVEAFRRAHHLDQASIDADPQFLDWEHGNLTLRSGSPAKALEGPASPVPPAMLLGHLATTTLVR